jgi:adenine-specific DNA-methyltransferase
MPTLHWIGKEKIINHHLDVPFRTLRHEHTHGQPDSGNRIIHGDNLEALKALMPFYQGKVKCIYIDPPYNTGNEGWVYNDKVNSPKIREWLEKTVKIDDLTRHDKWLCMMYPRLKLLRDLLSDDGAIFISIDDNELAQLKMICDDIFGEKNFIDNIIWDKKSSAKGVPPKNMMVNVHEYIVVYQKGGGFKFVGQERTEESGKFKNPDNDPRGPWRESNIKSTIKPIDEAFTIVDPNTGKEYTNTWAFSKKTLEKMIKEGRILWKDTLPKQKEFMREMKNENMAIKSNWGVFDAQSTTVFLKELLPGVKFDNPKPISLMEHLVKVATSSNAIILDSFAGSGTTAQAVLELNKEDSGDRQFILVEMEDNVAKKITAERVKRAIKKYDYKDGFEYCELKKPLFNEKGQINDAFSYDELASYIYFTETQTNIDKKKIKNSFVGESHDVSYYLIYTGKNKDLIQ